MHAFDLELSEAEVEVGDIEARLRVISMNDRELLRGLLQALEQKRQRLARIRAARGSGPRAASGHLSAFSASRRSPRQVSGGGLADRPLCA